MTSYDDAFFNYVNDGATRSARRLLPLLLRETPAVSVLDVGCGQGAWLAIWQELGISDITGVDGNYVNVSRLLIPREAFIPHDLRLRFDLGRRFDIVQSLEVAEHLPMSSAASFVESLVRHGDLILFSAAPKGQGGDNHVNEQDYEYWRAHFSSHGYVAIDFLRQHLIGDHDIAPWYRFNTLLYASSAIVPQLSVTLRDHLVPANESVSDLSPLHYRLRKRVIRALPIWLATRLAKAKERTTVTLGAMTRGEPS